MWVKEKQKIENVIMEGIEGILPGFTALIKNVSCP